MNWVQHVDDTQFALDLAEIRRLAQQGDASAIRFLARHPEHVAPPTFVDRWPIIAEETAKREAVTR